MMRPAGAAIALALTGCSAPAASTNPRTDEPSADRPAGVDPGARERTETEKDTRMSRNEILIVTERGALRAQLADNETAGALAKMLPLQLRMRDHLRQEKTGVLPSALPEGERQTGFSVGTLGLWENRDFVIFYGGGRVPAPGIVILGRVSGDLSQFANPDGVTVSLRRAD